MSSAISYIKYLKKIFHITFHYRPIMFGLPWVVSCSVMFSIRIAKANYLAAIVNFSDTVPNPYHPHNACHPHTSCWITIIYTKITLCMCIYNYIYIYICILYHIPSHPHDGCVMRKPSFLDSGSLPSLSARSLPSRRGVRPHKQLAICKSRHKKYLLGGIPTPLKNISQLGWMFSIYGKIKNVPNHQSAKKYLWLKSTQAPLCHF